DAAALRARLRARHADLSLGAQHRLLEIDLDVVPEVRSATPRLARPRSARASMGLESEQLAEQTAEEILELGESRWIEPGHVAARETLVTIAVVASPLVRVGEDRVRLGGLLEARFGLLVAGIAIGMQLEGGLAIGALDLVERGVAGHAEHLVVVSLL